MNDACDRARALTPSKPHARAAASPPRRGHYFTSNWPFCLITRPLALHPFRTSNINTTYCQPFKRTPTYEGKNTALHRNLKLSPIYLYKRQQCAILKQFCLKYFQSWWKESYLFVLCRRLNRRELWRGPLRSFLFLRRKPKSTSYERWFIC